jgi:hypothetical protein
MNQVPETENPATRIQFMHQRRGDLLFNCAAIGLESSQLAH